MQTAKCRSHTFDSRKIVDARHFVCFFVELRTATTNYVVHITRMLFIFSMGDTPNTGEIKFRKLIEWNAHFIRASNLWYTSSNEWSAIYLFYLSFSIQHFRLNVAKEASYHRNDTVQNEERQQ